MIRSTLFAVLCLLSLSVPAFAHAGHIGELAGHAHWLAVGAAVAAAALAAALAKQKGKKEKGEDELSVDEEVSEGEAA
ncbi:MAG: hypothetical protein QNJ29_01260 [Rhizobiaceae bacterium]|nr:hypothetical protein [Rhizobiaceae bacterium]